jgi:hypothetical protein
MSIIKGKIAMDGLRPSGILTNGLQPTASAPTSQAAPQAQPTQAVLSPPKKP